MRLAECLLLAGLCALPTAGAIAEPARLAASGVRAIIGCPGGGASVAGSGNDVTVSGHCTSLDVTGSDNLVSIDLGPGGVARIDGDRNRVVFTGPQAPEAVTHGAYNVVLPILAPSLATGPAAVTPAGPLLLDPTSPSFDVSCANRDVVIQGNGQRYVLRGGCRSVTVRGRLDTITAELLPGAPIAIGGDGVLLNYVLVGDGPAPVVRVTAPGLQAKQIQHYGESSLALTTFR